ncbi:MAG: proton-conducting transporter membrane subunit [Deltaproteobacteria bacterium]|nr:proton-conducting transporter membrane subunit [Deltaproteobacteria bacterium]
MWPIVGLIAAGILAGLTRSSAKVSGVVGAFGAILSSAAGIAMALRMLLKGTPEQGVVEWSLPWGSLPFGVDALSGFFLLVVYLLSLLAALYGYGYMAGKPPGRTGMSWLWFNLLIASMATLFVARHAVSFLLAWETMSLASFFLVGFENEEKDVRRASWIYLVATHLGTAFLLAMFVYWGTAVGSFDFAQFPRIRDFGPYAMGIVFVSAMLGFGTKAGFYPMHVWLPEAHPAAPSHVSALMSGVMIKTGIYALLRTITLMGDPPPWWGWCFVGIGAVSGILGVVFALAQHDLKRLLAYHSVENIGIIALGMGLGLLGWSYRQPAMMILGFSGAVLHVLNHALFKGLLFLGAGSVLHATGCRNLEHLGGLMRKMPITGTTFLIGAAAISGLPPLNGFVSELLIYLAAFRGATQQPAGLVIPSLVLIGSLALIGGLALACFAKAFGVIFLGEPRDPRIGAAHESKWMMTLPMLILAAACFAVGLGGVLIGPVLVLVVANITALTPEVVAGDSEWLRTTLWGVAFAGAGLFLLVGLVTAGRNLLLRGRVVSRAPTWDCGYAAPTARMQYTASSFAQPITLLFATFLRSSRHGKMPRGLFPAESSLETHVQDAAVEKVYTPAFLFIRRLFERMRVFQEGRVHVYVMYVGVTLLLLLFFAL